VLAVSVTAAVVIALVADVDPSGPWWMGLLTAAAVTWGAAGNLADLLAGTRRDRPSERSGVGPEDEVPPGGPAATVGVVVRWGDEPVEVARATVALARDVGPVHLVVAGGSVPDDLADDVVVHDATDPAAAITHAARALDTTAVLITSARGVPLRDACHRAAADLGDDHGWVTGRSAAFNRDRYGSDRRDVIGAALRRRAAAVGLVTWETDVTLVQRSLLAEHPLEPGRPMGTWLRRRASEGWRGRLVEDVVAIRAAPSSARGYWPDAVARQRALAADLAAAATTGPWRARACAALLVARALFAWPLLWWLLAPALVTAGAPFRSGAAAPVAAVALAAASRWVALRSSLGTDLRPGLDALSCAHHAPGSLLASTAVLTRRVRPTRWRLSSRPLVWGALALTPVAAWGLLAHPPGSTTSRAAAVASLLLLGLLWSFSVRSLVERTWDRTSYRVPLARPARVDGHHARLVDGSPAGAAVSVRDGARWSTGDEVDLTVPPAAGDGAPDGAVTMPAVVAARRVRGDEVVLGLELHAGGPELDRWAHVLLEGARTGGREVRAPVDTSTASRGRLVDRLVAAAVLVASLAVVATLVVVLLGFRPLVIRSGSMVPTYHVGDVVFVESVPAGSLRPGEVATIEDPALGESVTHRVRSVRDERGRLLVETRGDANESSEVTLLAPDDPVGVVRWSVPAIGRPATWLRASLGPILLVGLAAAVSAMALLAPHRGPRPPARQPEPPRTGSTAP
jgi:signal peptidase